MNMELRSGLPVVSRQKYSLRSFTAYHFAKNIDPAEKQLNLLLPGGSNPQTRIFARQLRKQSTNDVRYIQSVLAYFTNQGFEYTLHPGKAVRTRSTNSYSRARKAFVSIMQVHLLS
jgi:hypothetical protein